MRVLRGHGSQDRCVVVGQPHIPVARPERGERREQHLPWGDEARRSLGEPVEVLFTKARRARIVEVVAPCELGQQAPERPERRPGFDVHVTVPHQLAVGHAIVQKRERIGVEPNAGVQEQRELTGRGFQACAPSFEAAVAVPTHDGKRHLPVHADTRHVGTAVARSVVDDHELGVEAAAVERRQQSMDGRRQLRRFVAHRE